MENFRNRIKAEFVREKDNEKTFKLQSLFTFRGIPKPHTKYDSYTLKQNEVLTDTPIYLGFAILESSN